MEVYQVFREAFLSDFFLHKKVHNIHETMLLGANSQNAHTEPPTIHKYFGYALPCQDDSSQITANITLKKCTHFLL